MSRHRRGDTRDIATLILAHDEIPTFVSTFTAYLNIEKKLKLKLWKVGRCNFFRQNVKQCILSIAIIMSLCMPCCYMKTVWYKFSILRQICKALNILPPPHNPAVCVCVWRRVCTSLHKRMLPDRKTNHQYEIKHCYDWLHDMPMGANGRRNDGSIRLAEWQRNGTKHAAVPPQTRSHQLNTACRHYSRVADGVLHWSVVCISFLNDF